MAAAHPRNAPTNYDDDTQIIVDIYTTHCRFDASSGQSIWQLSCDASWRPEPATQATPAAEGEKKIKSRPAEATGDAGEQKYRAHQAD